MDHFEFDIQALHFGLVDVGNSFNHLERRKLNLAGCEGVVLDEVAIKKVFDATAKQLSRIKAQLMVFSH